jgi:hypothetical protein
VRLWSGLGDAQPGGLDGGDFTELEHSGTDGQPLTVKVVTYADREDGIEIADDAPEET